MKHYIYFIFLFSFLFAKGNNSWAQKTYLYKRVMIVKNGARTKKNDDAHYITFTDKGCYESDKDGFTTNNGFVKSTWLQNDLSAGVLLSPSA